MKLNFCTLFDSNYLSRGMAMYHSLSSHCPDFHLYVFAFDDRSCQFLKEQDYPGLTVISLSEFENEALLKIKPTRTPAEYCWTCTPSTIWYAIQRFNLDNCTYVDADLYFFSDPNMLVNEMGNKSVLITEHRYSPAYDQSASSGKYCVQFMTFKNNPGGMEVLSWWKEACIEWCFNRFEDGKFGDQKYLDDWLTRFSCVHNLQHLGGGVAPWNVQQYEFLSQNNAIRGKEISTGKIFDVVFFHFHGTKFFSDNMVYLTYTEYDLTKQVIDVFYKPYIRAIEKVNRQMKSAGITFDPNGAKTTSPWGKMGMKMKLYYYLKDLKASLKNITGKNLRFRMDHHYYYSVNDLL